MVYCYYVLLLCSCSHDKSSGIYYAVTMNSGAGLEHANVEMDQRTETLSSTCRWRWQC